MVQRIINYKNPQEDQESNETPNKLKNSYTGDVCSCCNKPIESTEYIVVDAGFKPKWIVCSNACSKIMRRKEEEREVIEDGRK